MHLNQREDLKTSSLKQCDTNISWQDLKSIDWSWQGSPSFEFPKAEQLSVNAEYWLWIPDAFKGY